MPNPFGVHPENQYRAKLAAMPPDEAARKEAARISKAVISNKRTRAIKGIVNAIFKTQIDPNSYQTDILKTFGYEIEECGVPTVAVMILLNMAYRACNGDTRAAEFLFSYGHIPNLNQQIKREELEILRHKGEPKVDVDKLEAVKKILLDIPSAIN